MALESAFQYPSDLNASLPDSTDAIPEGDNHIRGIKSVIKTTFPNINGAVTATQTELNLLDGVTASTAELNILDGVTASTAEINVLDGIPGTLTATEIGYLDGVTSAIQTQINAKGAITGQAWTGDHTFATQTAGDNSTKAATTAFVTTAITDAVLDGGVPSQTGNAGKVLTTDGSSVSWGDSGLVLVASTDITSSTATVDFTGISNASDEWVLAVINAVPATDAAVPWLRTSTDGGSTFAAANADYSWSKVTGYSSGNFGLGNDNGTTSAARIEMSGAVENTAALGGFSAQIRIVDPAGTTHNKTVVWQGNYYPSAASTCAVASGAAHRNSTADIDAIRFMFSTGDIASGKFRLYRIKK